MKILLFLAMCFSFGIAQAQMKLNGTVRDASGVPIMAVVFTNDFKAAVQCDTNGNFQINTLRHIDVDTLVVRQLGFKERIFYVRGTDGQPLVVIMERDVMALDSVQISSREADNLVHQAFVRIPSNYPQQKTIYPAFYRQAHKENGKYARLIEAVIDIREPKYVTQRFVDASTGIHINQLRRSWIYEDNGDDHGDHLVDVLEDNPVLYFFGSCLSPSAGKDVTYWIDTATLYRKDSVVVIGYSLHTLSDKKIEKGKIYINRPDMAVIRVECQRERNRQYPFQPTTGGHTWDLIDGGRVVQFHKIGHTYYLDSISMWYTHDVRERNFPAKAWRVDENFTLWAGTPNISDTAADISFSVFSGLYHRDYKYSPAFWSTYDLVKHHPYDTTIEKDLSRNTSLLEQFTHEDY